MSDTKFKDEDREQDDSGSPHDVDPFVGQENGLLDRQLG
jgi:hypothetical protein